MLKSSAADKTLLPTATQLKDLVASLEHRCVGCGFADLVLGYQIFLTESTALSAPQAHDLWKGCVLYPDTNGLEKLVDAFRQLSRVGDADSVIIKTTTCAPWVVAFTKWCLNLPPSIYFTDGTALLEQPTSRVTVVIDKDVRYSWGIEITVRKEVGVPDLIQAGQSPETYSGMVSIETYGHWLVRECELSTRIGLSAFEVALSFALKQVITNLSICILSHLLQSVVSPKRARELFGNTAERRRKAETCDMSFCQRHKHFRYAKETPWPGGASLLAITAGWSLD
ncbi:hypothetical protein VTN96DRAFT_666 [Rasamsonia emersonii]